MKRLSLKKLKMHLAKKNIIKVSDEEYLKYQYKEVLGKELNLDNPVTFNEKLQWLKINDRKKIYTKMADKYEAKEYAANIIGNEYIIPTIGVYDNFDEIQFEELPNQFVMKCTHDSGGIVICKNKNEFDKKKVKKKIEKLLKSNYYYLAREWPYKDIKPKIIIEEYIQDEDVNDLIDYKFYCFNGKAKVIVVCSNRKQELKESYFDSGWNKIDVLEGGHLRDENIEKPQNFDKMKEIAEKLSEGLLQVRIDLYSVKNKIYFGEFTFFSSCGYEKFEPENFDEELGKYINIETLK